MWTSRCSSAAQAKIFDVWHRNLFWRVFISAPNALSLCACNARRQRLLRAGRDRVLTIPAVGRKIAAVPEVTAEGGVARRGGAQC